MSAKPQAEAIKTPVTKSGAERIAEDLRGVDDLRSISLENRQKMLDVLRDEVRHLEGLPADKIPALNRNDILAIQLVAAIEASLAPEQQQDAKEEQPEHPLAIPNPALVEVSPPPPPDAKQPYKTHAQIVEEDLKKYEKSFEGDTPRNPKMIAKHLKRTIKELEKYGDRIEHKNRKDPNFGYDLSLGATLQHADRLQARFKQEAKDARLHRRIGRKLAGRGTPDRSAMSALPENGSPNSAPVSTPTSAESVPDARELAVERVTPATPEDIRAYAINIINLNDFLKRPDSSYDPVDIIRYTDRVLFANTGEHKDADLDRAALDIKIRMQEKLRQSRKGTSATPVGDPKSAPRNSASKIIAKARPHVKNIAKGVWDGPLVLYKDWRATNPAQRNQAVASGASQTPPPPSPDQKPNPDMPLPPPIGKFAREVHDDDVLPPMANSGTEPQVQPAAPEVGQQPRTAGDVARAAANRRLDRYEQDHPIRGALLRGFRSGRANGRGTPPPPIGAPKDSNGNPLRPIEELELVK